MGPKALCPGTGLAFAPLGGSPPVKRQICGHGVERAVLEVGNLIYLSFNNIKTKVNCDIL